MSVVASLTLYAPKFSQSELGVGYLEWLTNSIFVAAVCSLAVVWLARSATRQMALVPGVAQNLFELLIEGLYETLEEIVGKRLIKKTFGLFATLFIYILVNNWFGLVPGVGSVGWGKPTEHGFDLTVPLLRPTTADLNATLAMALVFMVLWLVWTIQEVGFLGFLHHLFGVKGGLKGLMAKLLVPIFFIVGLIEVVSILFRPVSLSLRLFGNIFAGENLLSTMITLGRTLHFPDWVAAVASVTLPLPFYFLELLVGILQATVFMLLCAVYLQLSTAHDEEEEH